MDLTVSAKAFLETIPKNCQGLYERVMKGEASPRQAIKANCQYCVGYELAVERIRNCGISKCPSWPYRPYQTENEGE